jgi:hypothetical protein
MSIAAASELDSTPSNPLTLPLAAAATCAALADWLFFGWPVGISLALFYGVAVAINRTHGSIFRSPCSPPPICDSRRIAIFYHVREIGGPGLSAHGAWSDISLTLHRNV